MFCPRMNNLTPLQPAAARVRVNTLLVRVAICITVNASSIDYVSLL